MPVRGTSKQLGSSQRWQSWLHRIAIGCTIILATVGVSASVLWAFNVRPRSIPFMTGVETTQPFQGAKLYDENDELIAEFHANRRIFLPLAKIPKLLRDAVLAVEDARFYDHFGVDPRGIIRAVYQNVRHGRIVQGGSTITQQLAKGLFLTPGKNLDRKLKEAVLALELERQYSKDRILEMYLNQVYFGHGAYGVEAAARTYFDRSAPELSLIQAAFLAGLPRAPGQYSPFNHPDLAQRRLAHVLNRMVETGVITPAEARLARSTDLGLTPPERRRMAGLYFVEYVRRLLAEKYGEEMVLKGGLRVYTTFSPQLQHLAERALQGGLKALEPRILAAAAGSAWAPGERPEGAMLTIEPQTGYIKALVGGSDFFRSGFNRAVEAKRPPGSAFKPFVYLAALEAGFTPATLIADSPVSYPVGRNGNPWQPDNYDGKFRGPITLQQGLEESVNVVTVKLQERIGIRRTIDVARRLGIRSPLTKDLTLALGSSALSLLELTSAYGALANRGEWMPPTPIRYITDSHGRLLEEYVPQGKQAVSPELAYLITHMLKGVVERGTGIGARVLGRPIAAKTGTTNDFSNAWFIGYTPSLVTGVWVGYDRPRSLGKDETGARVAVPIWVRYYTGGALANSSREKFPVPPGVIHLPVDEDPAGSCTRPVTMAFVLGTEPGVTCAEGSGKTSNAAES